MSAAWMMSASADICWSPNINLSSENTHSAAAEFGEKAKTIDRYDHYDRYPIKEISRNIPGFQGKYERNK